ncbi:MAG: TMEM175 family protein [Gemmatimonadota bacterium]
MLSQAALKHQPGGEKYFRWRGGEIRRIEGFADAVFAFAVTLLVVSLEVPRTYHELLGAMAGFLPFAISFAMLFWLWYQHYLFYRRYALEDLTSTLLTAVLLFVVLFYVYPLKFLWTAMTRIVLRTGLTVALPGGGSEAMIEAAQIKGLMGIFSAGYIAVFLVFATMYHHAWRRREFLQLSPLEQLMTRAHRTESLLMVLVGVASVVGALVGGGLTWLSYLSYWAIGPLQWWYWSRVDKVRRPLLATE